MPTIELNLDQLEDPYITMEVDLSDHLNGLDINFDESDIDELLDDDPSRCFEYLLGVHWEPNLEKVFLKFAKEHFDSAELLSFCAKLTQGYDVESAA